MEPFVPRQRCFRDNKEVTPLPSQLAHQRQCKTVLHCQDLFRELWRTRHLFSICFAVIRRYLSQHRTRDLHKSKITYRKKKTNSESNQPLCIMYFQLHIWKCTSLFTFTVILIFAILLVSPGSANRRGGSASLWLVANVCSKQNPWNVTKYIL